LTTLLVLASRSSVAAYSERSVAKMRAELAAA
jgi:hypothetical protein